MKAIKTIMLTVIFGACASLSFAQVLEDGTPVKLRIARTVSSADSRVGETVDFEVLEEIRVGTMLVVPKGGLALATITAAQAKRRMGHGGKLDINIDHVRLVDGEKAALRAVKTAHGGGHVGAMTGAIVATTILFWPAAPFFLFMHGNDITIPQGTEITAYVNGNLPLDAVRFQHLPTDVAAEFEHPAQPTPINDGRLMITNQASNPNQKYIRVVNGNGSVMFVPECIQTSTGKCK